MVSSQTENGWSSVPCTAFVFSLQEMEEEKSLQAYWHGRLLQKMLPFERGSLWTLLWALSTLPVNLHNKGWTFENLKS
jgi:hypothetical protein